MLGWFFKVGYAINPHFLGTVSALARCLNLTKNVKITSVQCWHYAALRLATTKLIIAPNFDLLSRNLENWLFQPWKTFTHIQKDAFMASIFKTKAGDLWGCQG